MNNVNYKLKMIINLMIICLIVYLGIKLFIYLLPILLIIIGAYYIYKFYKKNSIVIRKEKDSSNEKIIDAEIIDEKFDE